jgi:hypothetical protein
MSSIVERSATLAEHKTRPAWGGTTTNQAAPGTILVEHGAFASSLCHHRWCDCVPEGTHCVRSQDDDWSSDLERVYRYRVPEGTVVFRVESHGSDPMPAPPAGFVFCHNP